MPVQKTAFGGCLEQGGKDGFGYAEVAVCPAAFELDFKCACQATEERLDETTGV